MTKQYFFCGMLVFLVSSVFCQTYSVTDFGAKGDSSTNNTEYIQAAIDQASKTGGTVVVPAGVFFTGTLRLKTNGTLLLEKNAVLKGVPDIIDYPSVPIAYPQRNAAGPQSGKSLVLAESQDNITITGEGTIDGNGASPAFDEQLHPGISRPYGLLFVSCTNITVTNIHLRNSAMWMQRYLNCSFVRLMNLNVFNHANLNNDGMDIDDCHEVIVSGCVIDADDDALCFKSEGDRGVLHAVVTNCILSSHASALKMGTGSIAGFQSIQISNVVIRPSRAITLHHPYKQKGGLVGIDIASVDGAVIHGINVNNISIDSVETPFFIKLGNRLNRSSVTPAGRKGKIEGINISQVYVQNAGPIASSITGYPGNAVRQISLRDIFIAHRGGGLAKDTSLRVPENASAYPLNRMFDSRKLPACGFYVRHAEDINFNNIQLMLLNEDARPLIVMDDVKNASIHEVSLKESSNLVLIRLVNSANIRINGALDKQQVLSTGTKNIQLNNQPI